MTFIGIVTEQSKDIELEKAISDNLLDKSTIININSKNIDNIKNVKFETILIIETKTILSKLDMLKKIVSNAHYVIINSDIKSNLLLLENLESNVITFGFNNKSTITASSVNEESALICIQRNILDINNNKIEAQEVKVNLKNIKNAYKIMSMVGILAVYNRKNMEKIIKM